MGGETRLEVAEEMQVVRRADAEGSRSRRPSIRRKAKKSLCAECPLYLEHQKYKYRTLSWLSYPAAAVVIAMTAAYIRAGYEWVDLSLGSLLAEYQVLPHPLADHKLEGAAWLSAENAVVVVMGVLVVGLILQVTELAVFRFKW
jgi:hypothetical protein